MRLLQEIENEQSQSQEKGLEEEREKEIEDGKKLILNFLTGFESIPFDKLAPRQAYDQLAKIKDGLLKNNNTFVNKIITETGGTPLHYAIKSNVNIETIKLLIAAKSDVNAENKWYPLHLAIRYCKINTIQILIAAGAKVNYRADELTSLHCAIKYHSPKEVFLLLLSSNVDVNAETKKTPLHLACIEKLDIEIIRLLVCAGANVNAQTRLTPLQIAKKNKMLDVVSFLKKAGAVDEESIEEVSQKENKK
ncbi:cyclin-dependent kinase inhibitor 2c-related [Anaeramoeba flamelloides]|uniref:Cyclin-dependent kinase inhibitor 2c-related n=1 Tax=Anaeramoeba flamelloides TaxID=1746091 RepID=A0AAV7ZG26_9EUKA|nr:cyclin-dependent kinase inhibitor 2c-related [Anaeramoeba flamelloides]